MKKLSIISTLLLSALSFGLVLSSQVKGNDGIKVDEVSATSEEKDMSGKDRWEASNGDFISVDDWYYSNKGFSFEFKLAENYGSEPVRIVGALRSKGVQVSNYFYLTDQNGGTGGSFASQPNISKITAIGDGWYKTEVLFKSLPLLTNPAATGHETVDEIYARWGVQSGGVVYWPNVFMRNMKIIDGYEINQRTITRWDFNLFPYITNWKTSPSAKGFYIEYQTESTTKVPYKLSLQGIGYASNTTLFFNTDDVIGRDFDLGDGYRRLEMLIDDIPDKVTGSDGAILYGIDFFTYPDNNVARMSKIRASGTINQYSYTVSYHVDDEVIKKPSSGEVIKIDNPTKAGSHFVNWYSDSECTNLFDFSKTITSDTDLYAKFEAHTYGEYKHDDTGHWRECSVCHELETKVNHDFILEVEDEKYLKTPISCSHGAIYYKSCICGAAGEETFEVGTPDPSLHVLVDYEYEVTLDPTCEDKGSYHITAHCEFCTYILDEYRDIDPIGHEYEVSNWDLNKEELTATCTFVCKHDSSHVENKECEVSKNVVPATTLKQGQIIYSLKVTFNNNQYTKEIIDNTPKLDPVTPAPGTDNNLNTIIMAVAIGVPSVVAIGAVVTVLIVLKNKKRSKK